MKKLILLCILFFGTQVHLQAQNAPLSKQQTIDYISKLFKATYYFKDVKVDNLTVEDKTLMISLSSGEKSRSNLSDISDLTIRDAKTDNQFYIYQSQSKAPVLFHIQTEDDAKRLKKALEHLIEILKTEKNTDPFGE